MEKDESPPGSVLRGYDGRLLIAISVGWLAIRLGREAIPPLLPVIIDEVGITPSSAGFGLTVMWLVYALSQYPGGRFSDGLSRKTVLTASLVVLLGGFVVLSLVTTYLGILAGFVLVGLGAGLYFAPARALLVDVFGERRGQVFGIQSAAGSTGAASAAGLAVLAISLGVWQSAFLPVVALLALVLLALVVWHREEYVFEWVRLDLLGTGRRVFASRRVRLVLVAYVLVSFSWQGFLGFLPTFLLAEKNFDPVLSSGAYAMVFVVAIVVGPVAGRIADVFSRVLVSIVGLGIAIVGILTLLESGSPLIAFLGVFLAAVGLRSYPPVMQAYLMGLFPNDSMAGDFGGMKTIWTGIGSFSPTYVGLVAGRASFGTAFGGFIVCLVVGAVVLAYVHASR